jgi:hypothetical protein
MPRQMEISSGDGDRFEVQIERYMTNVAVDPGVFEMASRS